jgi:O-antigen/teichoic acid export membrane protein
LGIVRKEGVRNTIIYYSGMILGYFTTVILLPKVLHDDQYGLIRVLVPFSAMLAFFFQLGMPNVVVRFFPYLKNKANGHNGILFFVFAIEAVGVIATMLVFFIFKPGILHFYTQKAPLLVHYYYVLFPLAISITVFEVFNAYCRAQFKTNFATFLNEVNVRILIMALSLLYFFHFFSFQAFLYFYIAAYATNPLLMLYYVWRNKMLYLKPSKAIFQSQQSGKMLNYGLFNFFGGTTGMLTDKLDFLFIPGLISLADAGIYGVAVLLAQAIALPAKALLTILFPLTADAFKSNDREKLKYLYNTSSSIQLFAGSMVFIMVWINYDSFFTIVHKQFLLGKYAFLILSVGKLVDMATGINGLLVQNSKYYKNDLIFTVTLVVLTIINCNIFIPLYGLNGAAAATASAVILYNIFKFLFVWKTMKMQPFDINSLKITLTVLAVFFVGTYLPSSGNPVFDIIYRTCIVGFLFLISLLYLKITPEITNLILAVYDRGKRIARRPFGRK